MAVPARASVTLTPGHIGAPAGSLAALLLAEGFTVRLDLLEDPEPVEGYVDSETAQSILRRSQDGDVWAWFGARCVVGHPNSPRLTGEDYLGACSHITEADFFTPDGYWPSMVAEAFADFKKVATSACETLLRAQNVKVA